MASRGGRRAARPVLSLFLRILIARTGFPPVRARFAGRNLLSESRSPTAEGFMPLLLAPSIDPRVRPTGPPQPGCSQVHASLPLASLAPTEAPSGASAGVICHA